jgi:CheY-like chemotaxis protein
MIRVLIADDHGVIRDGLGRLIGALEDMTVVGLAADGEEAVQQARATDPDVVLMDLDMPNVDGIEATRRIGEVAPLAAVLVLTSFSDRPRILGALEAGATGYLLKDAAADEVPARPARGPHSPRRPAGARSAGRLVRTRARGAGAAPRGPPEQAHRTPAGDRREDGEVPPDADFPRARRHRPHAGGAVGRASRTPAAALSAQTKVPLRRGRAVADHVGSR